MASFILPRFRHQSSLRVMSLFTPLDNASGIYKIVVNKTNDTTYDNLNPLDTIDVKIPDPFAKIGYIGG